MRSHCCLLTFCSEKSPTSLLYVSIKSAFALRPPAYGLCGYCALITVCSGQKKKKNPNACLTLFENTKIKFVYITAALMGSLAICAITARWRINCFPGLYVTMVYCVLGCE